MSYRTECKAKDCENRTHWCPSCGIEETPTDVARSLGYCSVECAQKGIRRLRAELEKHRWIPVGERFPDTGKTVEVYTSCGEIRLDYLKSEYFFTGERGEDAYSVTHWRYINPPEE